MPQTQLVNYDRTYEGNAVKSEGLTKFNIMPENLKKVMSLNGKLRRGLNHYGICPSHHPGENSRKQK
jgi:hypothetical protein